MAVRYKRSPSASAPRLRERYTVMVNLGVPAAEAALARGSIERFKRALQSVGEDPERFPELIERLPPGRPKGTLNLCAECYDCGGIASACGTCGKVGP